MSELNTIRREIATRLREGDPTEKDIEEIANDYPDLLEEKEKLEEKVRKCAEGILKIKETMEKMMEATTKSQAEMVGVVEQLHSEAMRASMKLVSAEMSLALLQVENKELRRRLRATEPEGEVEEGGEDYEPDFEWLSELERNR